MAVSQDLANNIRNSVDIVEIISSYIPLTKKGKNFFGMCPFHDNHSPSMYVSKDKQIYKCFSCGAMGNVINFVMDYEKVNFLDALKILTNMYGIDIDESIVGIMTDKVLSEYVDNSKLIYNPIVIYGNETKIKECIDNINKYITSSNKSLLCINGNSFIPDIEKLNIDDCSVFVLDDITKLENNKEAQYKLFDVFNHLYDTNTLIIITSIKKPEDLVGFEERLITRLNWGKVIRV